MPTVYFYAVREDIVDLAEFASTALELEMYEQYSEHNRPLRRGSRAVVGGDGRILSRHSPPAAGARFAVA